ncbi:MAG: SIMPL domain-containing protein [Anaerolineales bacterium]|nr:MAG: SIMPL domain-containing protein [Anaerolineales bacterium]
MVKKSIVFVALAGLLLAACGAAAPTSVAPGPNVPVSGITVAGHGEVRLVPNIATVTIGVRTNGANVSEVVAENAASVSSVMQALSNLGIAPEDMQTSNFNVYANQGYDPVTGLPGEITTYSVENTVNVTVRDLASLGELLDRAVSAGANSIWGVSFDVDDKSSAQAEARDIAVQKAMAEAQALAAAAGVTLGDIISISYTPTGYYYGPMFGMGGGGAAAESSTSIVPGQITVGADVSITFALK